LFYENNHLNIDNECYENDDDNDLVLVIIGPWLWLKDNNKSFLTLRCA
jgi:hypothetical protein